MHGAKLSSAAVEGNRHMQLPPLRASGAHSTVLASDTLPNSGSAPPNASKPFSIPSMGDDTSRKLEATLLPLPAVA